MRLSIRFWTRPLLVARSRCRARRRTSAPTSIPNGLPDGRSTSPTKSSRRRAGRRHREGARQHEGIRGRRRSPAMRRRRTGFPTSIRRAPRVGHGRPGAAIRLRLLPPDVGPGPSGIRRHRRHARRLLDPADGVLQDRRAQGRRAHGADRARPRRTRTCARPPNISPRLKPSVWVKVIETATPPKTFIATAGRHRVLHPDGGTEPIGRRILEIPEDPIRTEIRDPHSGFIAYVPPGSIAKGEALVKTGAPGRRCSARSVTARG